MKPIRVHETLDRQVAARRLQVLAEGEHVDIVFTPALHDFDHFLVSLANAQHQAGFGQFFYRSCREFRVGFGRASCMLFVDSA